MQLRRGIPTDFAVVMDRVVTSFREHTPGHGRFEDLYPDSVMPETMHQWRLAVVDGAIVAGMQLVPRPLICGGQVRLSGMGLGNVFCYPTHRGRGLMSGLLERCIRDMEEEGTGVCLLGGDRSRYGNFGWEHAGADRALTLSASVTRFVRDGASVSSRELKAWTGEAEDSARMFDAYRGLPFRTERSAEEFALVLRRPGQVVWMSEGEGKGFAYASVRGNSILEYAGDVTAFDPIVDYLLGTGTWHVALPPVEGQGPLETLLLGRAQHYQVRPTGMVRIVSLRRVVESYLPLLKVRLQGWEGDLAVRVSDNGETIKIAGENGTIGIEEVGSDHTALEVSRRELAQLFFGPFPPDLGDWFRHSAVRRLFPLPLHWHALSHV